jgi:cytochrome b-561
MKAPSNDTTSGEGLLRSQGPDESSILLEEHDPNLEDNGGLATEQEDTRGLIQPGAPRREEDALMNEGEAMPRPAPASAQYLAMGSIGAAAMSLVLASSWILQLGGLNPSLRVTNQRVFNWHPLLMIVAFLSMTIGSLAFRLNSFLAWDSRPGDSSSSLPLVRQRSDRRRRCAKLVHAGSWCLAAACMGFAVAAVLQSHNNPEKPIANLYSMHSWVGLLVLFSYVAQLVAGLLVFYDWLRVSAAKKAWILRIHKTAGPIIYLCTALTILLGIQEKEGFVGCSYPVTEPDTIPFRHVFKIPSACWASHALGISVLLVAILTVSALWVGPMSQFDGDSRRSR